MSDLFFYDNIFYYTDFRTNDVFVFNIPNLQGILAARVAVNPKNSCHLGNKFE